MFLRIPFPVGLQVSVGNKKCFASDLEGGSERGAVFLLPRGVCGAPTLLLTAGLACEREAAPDLSPPLPPDLVHQFAASSRVRGQLHQGMPGTCRVKFGAGERNAGSRLSTASVPVLTHSQLLPSLPHGIQLSPQQLQLNPGPAAHRDSLPQLMQVQREEPRTLHSLSHTGVLHC